MAFDLLQTVEYGGCSAKLSPTELSKILEKIPTVSHPNLMVDIETHDDAGVYKLNETTALIFTTDFFPPICSNPFEFGQIAAANALSDVYAMGGTPLLALNLMMFASSKAPMEALAEILQGGQDKANEAGALIIGGHTIDDHPPKYGMAVLGTVHPDKLITNAGVEPGDLMILTKPLGTGALVAGHRLEMASETAYLKALEQMKLLNKTGAALMQKYNVKGATDVTGFGLMGHAQKMAHASNVTMRLDSTKLPLLEQVYDLFEDGCIPGAAFRNLDYVKDSVKFRSNIDYNLKMLAHDAQTSGGLLMAVKPDKAHQLLEDLHNSGCHPYASIIGEAHPKGSCDVILD